MPDLSEVQMVLVGSIAATLYPNGTSQPSIANANIKVYPGWPVPNVLENDITAGGAHVSVFASPTERKIPNYLGRGYYTVNPGAPTITADVSGNMVTFGGTVSVPQNIYLLIDGQGYHHPVQADDTLTMIATAFSALIPSSSSYGAVLTLPPSHSITARVGGVGTAARELKRQEKEFIVTVWSPTPALRDTVALAIDSALAESSDIVFADGSHGIKLYARTFQTDQLEKYQLYRRDIVYSVQYATTQIISAPQVIAPVLNIETPVEIKNIQE
ncbi:hypothetical protein [Martelella alba]|uniref:Uncharacterized protein n=1 Tax=Martelella alba TaxID=2590451 RepID=A0ABY2SGK8_9HYPH|nr:hypothetical protein [Martelella alba]TKI03575.1 hypothetical protein FCN80_21085 [Martelella alba]